MSFDNLHIGDRSWNPKGEAYGDVTGNLTLGCKEVEMIIDEPSPYIRRTYDFLRWIEIPKNTANVVLTVGETGAKWDLSEPATDVKTDVFDPYFGRPDRSDLYLVFSDRMHQLSLLQTEVKLEFFDSEGTEIVERTRTSGGCYPAERSKALVDQDFECQVSIVRRTFSSKSLAVQQIGKARTLTATKSVGTLI